MSTKIATTPNTALDAARKSPLFSVVESYLDTVITSKGNSPTVSQKEVFLLDCVANGWNPLKKEVYMIGYDSKDGPVFNTIPSIAAYTLAAAATGEYAGLDQPRFAFNGNKLESCSVTVYRIVQGQRCAFTGNAYYDERVQRKPVWVNGIKEEGEPTEQWTKQPRTMLEKCARAAALRAAFPERLAAYYTSDEMPAIDAVKIDDAVTITDAQLKKILKDLFPKLAKLQGRSVEELQAATAATFKKAGLTELTKSEASKVIEAALAKIEELSARDSDEAEAGAPLIEGRPAHTEV